MHKLDRSERPRIFCFTLGHYDLEVAVYGLQAKLWMDKIRMDKITSTDQSSIFFYDMGHPKSGCSDLLPQDTTPSTVYSGICLPQSTRYNSLRMVVGRFYASRKDSSCILSSETWMLDTCI